MPGARTGRDEVWGGRMGIYCLTGTEFQLRESENFRRWMMVTVVQQCECT